MARGGAISAFGHGRCDRGHRSTGAVIGVPRSAAARRAERPGIVLIVPVSW
jgi:hypothetical protein